MPVIHNADTRRTETPNAVMTTFASPTQGESELSMWRVDMPPGAEGPLHAFDVQQVWTVLDGGATVMLGNESVRASTGDTIVMSKNVPRQVRADAGKGFTAVVAAPAGGMAYNPGGVTPEGACAMAPRDADRVLPAWTV